MSAKILIAGIGNIFLGDDGFGIEVVSILLQHKLIPEVGVCDFGIRGFDLAYTLLDDWDVVILVDAMSRGEAPGTLFLLEPNLNEPRSSQFRLNPHGMDPTQVLNLAASFGPIRTRVLVVGCEPHDFGDELEGRMELSPVMRERLPEAVDMIVELVQKLCSDLNQLSEHIETTGEVTV